jgi:hypothetical protein
VNFSLHDLSARVAHLDSEVDALTTMLDSLSPTQHAGPGQVLSEIGNFAMLGGAVVGASPLGPLLMAVGASFMFAGSTAQYINGRGTLANVVITGVLAGAAARQGIVASNASRAAAKADGYLHANAMKHASDILTEANVEIDPSELMSRSEYWVGPTGTGTNASNLAENVTSTTYNNMDSTSLRGRLQRKILEYSNRLPLHGTMVHRSTYVEDGTLYRESVVAGVGSGASDVAVRAARRYRNEKIVKNVRTEYEGQKYTAAGSATFGEYRYRESWDGSAWNLDLTYDPYSVGSNASGLNLLSKTIDPANFGSHKLFKSDVSLMNRDEFDGLLKTYATNKDNWTPYGYNCLDTSKELFLATTKYKFPSWWSEAHKLSWMKETYGVARKVTANAENLRVFTEDVDDALDVYGEVVSAHTQAVNSLDARQSELESQLRALMDGLFPKKTWHDTDGLNTDA